MNNQTIGAKIKTLREQKGLSQGQLALKVGKSTALISLYEIDKRFPRNEDLIKLSEIFDVSTDFLLGVDEKTVEDLPVYKVMTNYVPVYGCIPAGVPFEAIENRLDDVAIPEWLAKKRDLFGLLIKGDSMNKTLPDGVIAVFQKTENLENGEIGAILVNGYDATVKRFYKLHDGVMLEPHSYNPDYQPVIYRDGEEPIKILGKLLWYTPIGIVK